MKKTTMPTLSPSSFLDEDTDDFGSFGPVSFEEIQEAIEDLAAEGVIVDTGLRRLNPLTGEPAIVWALAPEKQN